MSELATLALARLSDALEIAEMSRDLIEYGLDLVVDAARACGDPSRAANPRRRGRPAPAAGSPRSPSCTSATRARISIFSRSPRGIAAKASAASSWSGSRRRRSKPASFASIWSCAPRTCRAAILRTHRLRRAECRPGLLPGARGGAADDAAPWQERRAVSAWMQLAPVRLDSPRGGCRRSGLVAVRGNIRRGRRCGAAPRARPRHDAHRYGGDVRLGRRRENHRPGDRRPARRGVPRLQGIAEPCVAGAPRSPPARARSRG